MKKPPRRGNGSGGGTLDQTEGASPQAEQPSGSGAGRGRRTIRRDGDGRRDKVGAAGAALSGGCPANDAASGALVLAEQASLGPGWTPIQ